MKREVDLRASVQLQSSGAFALVQLHSTETLPSVSTVALTLSSGSTMTVSLFARIGGIKEVTMY